MSDRRKPYVRMMPKGYLSTGGTGGPVRFMAAAEGYATVRRKGCAPFIVPVTHWNSWDLVDA